MTWEIDPTHSHVSFATRVMSVSTTRGHFNALRGQLHIDEQHPANSWVKATINRHDFGLGQGAAVRFAASAMVTIEIDLEAIQQSVEVQEAAATFQ